MAGKTRQLNLKTGLTIRFFFTQNSSDIVNEFVKRTMNVLIVEDELIIAKVYSIHLEKCGLKISGIASNIEDATKKFNENKPDLLVVDINLKRGESGIDFVKQIRETSDVPVIFTTGNSVSQTKELTSNITNASFMIKPVNPHELQKIVKETLNLS